MIEKTALWLARHYVKKQIITEEDTEVYAYGFELLVAAVVNAVVLMAVALITGYVWQTIFYGTAFVLLRTTAGGFHASTHLRCLLLLLCTSAATMLVIRFLPSAYVLAVIVFMAVISAVLVVIFSPVEDHNNPFTPERKLKLRRLSLITLVVLVMAVVLCMLLWREGALALVCGICSVAGSLPAGHLKLDISGHG